MKPISIINALPNIHMKTPLKSKTLAKFLFAAALFAVGVGSASAGGIIYDLRATGGTGVTILNNKSVAGVAPGSTITFDLIAVVSGTNGVTDEGYQSGLLNLQTFVNSGVKNVRTDFTGKALGVGFDGGGSSTGAFTDLNADGDIDVGSTVTNTSNANYFTPRAAAMVTTGTQINVDTKEFVAGTFTITIGAITDLNSATPTFANVKFTNALAAGQNAQRAAYRADNATKSGANVAPYALTFGSDVSIAAVPEPSAFGMVIVGALSMVGFRRFGLRR